MSGSEDECVCVCALWHGVFHSQFKEFCTRLVERTCPMTCVLPRLLLFPMFQFGRHMCCWAVLQHDSIRFRGLGGNWQLFMQ